MSRKVVYLNLLPDVNENAVTKLHDGLKVRYQRNSVRKFFGNSYQVIRYDVFDMLKLSKLGVISWSDGTVTRKQVNDVRSDCKDAWKIWVSAHGHMDCTDYVYGGQFSGPKPLCSWAQMCEFLSYLLEDRTTKRQIELMICYGARTLAYRDDQQTAVSPELIKTSLGYKIFSDLGKNGLPLVVTARTGATGMDELAGCVTVETDEHVELDYQRRTVLETTEYKAIDAWIKQLPPDQRRVLGNTYQKMTTREVDAVAANTEDERKAQKYFHQQALYREIRAQQNTMSSSNSYGTIRYLTTKTGIAVKNINNNAMLYEGAWL